MTDTISLAFDLSIDTVEKLVLVQEDLEAEILDRGGAVRWIEAPSIHVTLKLIRGVDPALYFDICETVANVADSLVPFKVSVKGIGAHPTPKIPRLIYARIETGTDLVEGLHKVLEMHLDHIGLLPDEREFKTWVLLGRVLTPEGRVDISDLIRGFSETELGASHVKDLIMFRWKLAASGPTWRVHQRFILGNPR